MIVVRNLELDPALLQRLNQIWCVVFDGKSLTCSKNVPDMLFITFTFGPTWEVRGLGDTAIVELCVRSCVFTWINARSLSSSP